MLPLSGIFFSFSARLMAPVLRWPCHCPLTFLLALSVHSCGQLILSERLSSLLLIVAGTSSVSSGRTAAPSSCPRDQKLLGWTDEKFCRSLIVPAHSLFSLVNCYYRTLSELHQLALHYDVTGVPLSLSLSPHFVSFSLI